MRMAAKVSQSMIACKRACMYVFLCVSVLRCLCLACTPSRQPATHTHTQSHTHTHTVMHTDNQTSRAEIMGILPHSHFFAHSLIHTDYQPSHAEILDLLSRDPMKDPTQHPFGESVCNALLTGTSPRARV